MYRTMLIALLAAPVGGALVQVQVYRVLSFVVPVALITALGLIAVLIARRLYYPITSIVIGAALGIVMGLAVGGVTSLHPEFGVSAGLVTGLIVAGAVEIFERQRREPPGADEIRLVEVRRWLWRNGWQGLALGVLMGSIVWFVFGLTILLNNDKPFNPEYIAGIIRGISPFGIATAGGVGLSLGVVFGLLGGQPTVGSQDRPNEGIRRSLRTALLAGGATVAALAGPAPFILHISPAVARAILRRLPNSWISRRPRSTGSGDTTPN